MASGVHAGYRKVYRQAFVKFAITRGGEVGLNSLREVASKSGLAERYFWNMNSPGVVHISPRTIKNISRTLQVTPAALLAAANNKDNISDQGPGKWFIKNPAVFSDFIYFRIEALGYRSNAVASRACGLNSAYIGHIDSQLLQYVTPGTLAKLAAGLQMTEQEIINQGGLAR